MVGGRADERLRIGIAADDAVQDDVVRGLDVLRVADEVAEPPLDTLLEPRLAQQLAGRRLVLR